MSLVFDLAWPDPLWRDIALPMQNGGKQGADMQAGDMQALAERAGAALPSALFPDGENEISLVLMDDAGIQALNAQYRSKDTPTNVLSFPAVNAPGLLGDIILARETVLGEAADSGKTPLDHITHLIIHGLLHLRGHDHIDASEAEAMEAIEIGALEKLGIANPYILRA